MQLHLTIVEILLEFGPFDQQLDSTINLLKIKSHKCVFFLNILAVLP